MKWLQDNPVGMILAAISGFFALLILVMTIVWNLPVSVETDGADAEVTTAGQAGLASHRDRRTGRLPGDQRQAGIQ